MVCAKCATVGGGSVLVIGLTEDDITELRNKLTKTKQGGPEWGFTSMVVFLEKDKEAVFKVMEQIGPMRRQDDLFPNAGDG